MGDMSISFYYYFRIEKWLQENEEIFWGGKISPEFNRYEIPQ
jgi:hypothetical protein